MLISGIQKLTTLDYPGKFAAVVFTAGCNMRCPFCHNPEMVVPEQIAMIKESFIPPEAVLNFLKTRVGKLDGVSICGGEPTVQTDLYDFVKSIKNLGLLVKIDTNGRDASLIKKLIQEQLLDYVAIDCKHEIIKTHNTIQKKYNDVTGTTLPESFYENFDELLNFLRDTNMIPYEYRTTVIKGIHDENDINNITKYLQGIDNYYLQNYRSGNILDPKFLGRSFEREELEHFVSIAKKYITNVQIRE